MWTMGRGDVTWTTGRKGADGAQLTAGLSSLSRVARAAVNLSFSFRTPSPHDSLALKKIRAVSVETLCREPSGLEALSTEFHVRQ